MTCMQSTISVLAILLLAPLAAMPDSPVTGPIDGHPSGYPGVNSGERAWGGWKEDATRTLTRDKPQTEDRVRLVDCPNPLEIAVFSAQFKAPK